MHLQGRRIMLLCGLRAALPLYTGLGQGWDVVLLRGLLPAKGCGLLLLPAHRAPVVSSRRPPGTRQLSTVDGTARPLENGVRPLQAPACRRIGTCIPSRAIIVGTFRSGDARVHVCTARMRPAQARRVRCLLLRRCAASRPQPLICFDRLPMACWPAGSVRICTWPLTAGACLSASEPVGQSGVCRVV